MPEPNDNNNSGAVKDGSNNDGSNKKVTFDDAQKAAINDIVEERLGRERKGHKTEVEQLQAKIKELEGKAKPNKGGDNGGAGEDDTDLKTQFQRILNDQKQATKTAEEAVAAHLKTITDLQSENLALRKDMAFNDAAAGLNFINVKTVKKLFGDQIEQDGETGAWIVRGEDGKVVLNDAMKPASISEFLSDIASKHDYLVNGEVKSGTGASESKSGATVSVRSKADFKSTEEKVAWIKKHGAAAYANLPLK